MACVFMITEERHIMDMFAAVTQEIYEVGHVIMMTPLHLKLEQWHAKMQQQLEHEHCLAKEAAGFEMLCRL